MNHRRVALTSLSLGKVARRAGIGVETIRFYEREGLLAPPLGEIRATDFIPSALSAESSLLGAQRKLGFSLKEIKELLQLRRNSSSTCEDIREKAEAKIANVEAKIAMLKKMKQALTELSAALRGAPRSASAGCPACKETIELVNRVACLSCEVTVLDMRDTRIANRAKELGISTVPAVVIDGKLAECCKNRGVDEATLRVAGLGGAV
jgi:glutaredoxin 3